MALTRTFAAASKRLDADVVLLWVWLDCVASKWDRSESVHFVTMNFLGFGGEWKDLRLPVCCIDLA